jgi:hypothetical protein
VSEAAVPSCLEEIAIVLSLADAIAGDDVPGVVFAVEMLGALSQMKLRAQPPF